ncbi:uncharacterized protein N7477_006924 [Penicillium maclennaniae]|uniref:uncharacterized protein n=1 Tax=Penicillium maclennaniae TaxID=1343394 RepID=UPI00253F8D01|nr:uncharacterized protein N7477_006924 [Penicillium maclennaniae]KAJ5668354.1 hypothetical protein N7477_006924 [Penicillium maclennaniae]
MSTQLTRGGSTDESGVWHELGHGQITKIWEILNESESEHTIIPDLYNRIYDAVPEVIREVFPSTQFVGLALAMRNVIRVHSFLDPANHKPGVPLDWISYHFYATSNNSTAQNEAAQSF